MTKSARARFDPAALRRLAGDTVFGRGERYHRDGAVEIMSIDEARVVAEVSGTEAYHVELTGSGSEIGGACSCPAFDRGFCKHLVATALAANETGGKAIRILEDRTSRIRAHLTAKSRDELVAMLMEMAARDRGILQALDLASAMTTGDSRAIEARLAKLLDDLLRPRDFIDYGAARIWAGRFGDVLDSIAQLVPTGGPVDAGRAAVAFRLAERAMDGLGAVVERIDDSDGRCGGLMHRAVEIHIAAAAALRPEPVAFAQALFARAMNDEFDVFFDAVDVYGEALRPAGLAEYRRLAGEAWEAHVEARRKLGRDAPAFDSRGYRLRELVDRFAERDGDVEARIALRAADLTSPFDYLRLAEFCLEAGREDEALRRAEEGLWMFEDRPPEARLVAFAVKLLQKTGRREDALACLWRAFEAAPDLDSYLRLREFGGAAVCERALACLAVRQPAGRRPSAPGWVAWGVADLPVRILTHEGQFDRAWRVHRERPCSVGAQVDLARASEATHPAEALAVYRARAEELAQQGGDQSYRGASALLDRMANLQPKPDHSAYLAGFKERYKRRRTLIKMLA